MGKQRHCLTIVGETEDQNSSMRHLNLPFYDLVLVADSETGQKMADLCAEARNIEKLRFLYPLEETPERDRFEKLLGNVRKAAAPPCLAAYLNRDGIIVREIGLEAAVAIEVRCKEIDANRVLVICNPIIASAAVLRMDAVKDEHHMRTVHMMPLQPLRGYRMEFTRSIDDIDFCSFELF